HAAGHRRWSSPHRSSCTHCPVSVSVPAGTCPPRGGATSLPSTDTCPARRKPQVRGPGPLVACTAMSTSTPPDWRSANQALWDERVPLHVAGDFYDLEGFRAGAEALRDFELAEVGDVTGKSLLHLQ